VKQKLSLLANTDNVLSMSQSTIDAFKIDDNSKEIAVSTLHLFLKKFENHFAVSKINKLVDNKLAPFDFVYMAKYPLPASFNSTTNRGVINIALFNKRDISNVNSRDLYALLVYCYTFSTFIFTPLKLDVYSYIADYMFSIYMKIYAKKFGLAGSYETEIPKFRFFINYFIMISFFNSDSENAKIKASNLAKFNISKLDIDINNYDFQKISDLIRCLSDSNVLKGMSMYYFVSTMVNRVLTHNICMFEDEVRFMATLAGSSVGSNVLFPPNLQFYNKTLYDKILNYIETVIS
jgi:hypothetical protein